MTIEFGKSLPRASSPFTREVRPELEVLGDRERCEDPSSLHRKLAGPPETRVDGAYSFIVKNLKEGSEIEGKGVYKEFNKPEKLVFTWSWSHHPDVPETLVTVQFKDVDGGTEVTLNHDLFITEESRVEHNKGWENCFNNFEKIFAA